MSQSDADIAARIERERAYFDAHYESSARTAQMKYYAALEPCRLAYMAEIVERARDGRVLEYGCGEGVASMATAPVAKQAIGIDISERGVRTAQEEADRRGLANAEFRVMDAHKTEFEDESFDLVTATGVIHHLDVPVAFKEIHRLLKPGGTGLFVEALGHNPAIALYRRLTPAARSDDEAPLKRRDFRVAEALFDKVEYDFHGLATLAAVPVWGSRFGLPMLKATRALDRVLLSVPGLRWNAWAVLVRLKKQR